MLIFIYSIIYYYLQCYIINFKLEINNYIYQNQTTHYEID